MHGWKSSNPPWHAPKATSKPWSSAVETSPRHSLHEEMGIDVTYNEDGRILVESRPRVVSDGVVGTTARDGNEVAWRLDWRVVD